MTMIQPDGRVHLSSSRPLSFGELVAVVGSAARAQGEPLAARPRPHCSVVCDACGGREVEPKIWLSQGSIELLCANPACRRTLAVLWLACEPGHQLRLNRDHPQSCINLAIHEHSHGAKGHHGNTLKTGDDVLIRTGTSVPQVGRVIALHQDPATHATVAMVVCQEATINRLAAGLELRVQRVENLELVETRDLRRIERGPLAGFRSWGEGRPDAFPLIAPLCAPKAAGPPVDRGVDSSSGGEEG